MNKFFKNKNHKGITLVEAIGVIILGLVLISIALTQYFSAREKTRVSSATSNMSSIFTNVTDFYDGADTSSLDNQLAVEAGLVPKGMRVDTGNAIKNSWIGDVTISDYTAGGGQGFSVETAGVTSRDICISVLRSQENVGWDSFESSVASGTLVDFVDAATDPTEYNTACNTDAKVDLTFYFNG